MTRLRTGHRYCPPEMLSCSRLPRGVAPLIGASIIAWTTSHHGGTKEAALSSWIPLAGYVAILSLIGIITTFFTPETRARDLDDLRDAGQDVGI